MNFELHTFLAFVLQEGTSKFANIDNRLNNRHLNKVSRVEINPFMRLGSDGYFNITVRENELRIRLLKDSAVHKV